MMPTNQIKILQARFMNTPINTQVELSGYMSKAPLLKIYDSGVKRATLILYTYLYHTDPAGKQKSTIKWQRIIAWGRTADQVSRMLHKGDKVRIQGKLQFYTVNLKNGKTREQEEIILDQFSIELKSSETTSLRA